MCKYTYMYIYTLGCFIKKRKHHTKLHLLRQKANLSLDKNQDVFQFGGSEYIS